MAKIDLKFLDNEDDESYIKVEMYENHETKSIYILASDDSKFFEIYLDKSTAIKFAKTLRTEINKIQ